ncbi:MAG TPA: energy-coupling factor transporter transmembrane component T [Aeromicrobium sp.]|nr:energy-coupling factor transporter transmembrane component T [Aeromicrobium sp.]
MTGWLARVNPLVLLWVGFAALAGSFAVRTLPIAVATVGAYVLAALLFTPRPKYVLICLAFAVLAASTVVYSTWRLGGRDLEMAVTAGLRIVVLAWPGSVAAGFIDPARLGDYLAQSLRLPARGVAAFSASLQRFAGLAQTWETLTRTRRARGVGPGASPVGLVRYTGELTFALLVHAMRDATRVSIAMDARGFASAGSRTWLEPATWAKGDVAGLAIASTLGALPVVLFFLGW